MTEWLHPAGPYLAGGLLLGLVPPARRRGLLLAVPLLALGLALTLPDGSGPPRALWGQTVIVLRVDPLARVFAVVFALIGALGTLYGVSEARARLHAAAFVATGAGLGIVLAGDWLTLYVWWETLAVASFVLVGDGGTGRARAAAVRYLLVHATGGACLLAGIVWRLAGGGSPAVGPLAAEGPGILVLLAFAVNAAIPPLHGWLTDAYPESSPAAAVLLSAFATKAAVYALARVFPGVEALVWLGAIMTLYGVVFAILENDVRRLLAYHIVSQVGYMVTGVGLGTPLGVSGAAAHAFCHILYKGLLFMAAGAVVHATGRRRLSELGGLGRTMPATLGLYTVGALSISGAPLLNGFVSKSLVIAAAAAEHRLLVEWTLELAAVGTFLSVGLKLPQLAFGGAARGLRPRALPPSMTAAMTLVALACLLIGVYPDLLYRWLPDPPGYAPYAAPHVLGSLQLLLGTAVAYVWLRARLEAKATVSRDVDRLYRAAGRGVLRAIAPALAGAADALERWADRLAARSPVAPGAGLGGPVGRGILVALAALGLALVLLGRGG